MNEMVTNSQPRCKTATFAVVGDKGAGKKQGRKTENWAWRGLASDLS